jgi:glycerophosphoryl diester phosphodiesterase
MAVAPDGTMLGNMKAKIGLLEVEFDPSKKYYKKAGFYGTKLQPHYEYLDQGRRPWLYRPGGPAMVPNDKFMGYPRVCAHRGFNTVAPENSMPAYGMAVSLGAEEIEFDIRLTKDGELVSIHDANLERVSDGIGFIEDYTLEELYKFDFGVKFGEKFKGLKILTFDDILKKFSCQAVMNIHVKQRENFYETPTDPKNQIYAQKIYAKLKQYDCVQYAYIMSVDDELHQILSEIAPDLKRCMGAKPCKPWQIVDDAIKMKCDKVQLYAPYFNQEMIDKAHANGIMCNVFYTDDPSKAIEYIEMGIDTILTNDYLSVANAVKEWKKHHA